MKYKDYKRLSDDDMDTLGELPYADALILKGALEDENKTFEVQACIVAWVRCACEGRRGRKRCHECDGEGYIEQESDWYTIQYNWDLSHCYRLAPGQMGKCEDAVYFVENVHEDEYQIRDPAQNPIATVHSSADALLIVDLLNKNLAKSSGGE